MARFQQTATVNTAPDAVYGYPADITKHQPPAPPPGIAKHTPDQTCDSKPTQVAFTEFGGSLGAPNVVSVAPGLRLCLRRNGKYDNARDDSERRPDTP